jgi:hypothetical protein
VIVMSPCRFLVDGATFVGAARADALRAIIVAGLDALEKKRG